MIKFTENDFLELYKEANITDKSTIKDTEDDGKACLASLDDLIKHLSDAKLYLTHITEGKTTANRTVDDDKDALLDYLIEARKCASLLVERANVKTLRQNTFNKIEDKLGEIFLLYDNIIEREDIVHNNVYTNVLIQCEHEIDRFLQALLNSILINRISVTHRNLTPLQATDFTFNSYHNFFIQDRAAKNEENEKKH